MSQPNGESGRKHTRFPPRPGTNCDLLTHEALAPLPSPPAPPFFLLLHLLSSTLFPICSPFLLFFLFPSSPSSFYLFLPSLPFLLLLLLPSVPINSPLKKKTPAVFRKSAQSTAQAEAAQPSQDARTQGRLSQPKHTGMSTLSEGSLLQDFYSPFRTRVPRRGCGSRCESCAAAGGVGTG